MEMDIAYGCCFGPCSPFGPLAEIADAYLTILAGGVLTALIRRAGRALAGA